LAARPLEVDLGASNPTRPIEENSMNTIPEERIILEERDIRVTNLRAIVGNKTYAMSNVTSVSLNKKDPSSCLSVTFLLIGVGLLGLFLLSLIQLLSSAIAVPRSVATPTLVLLLLGGGFLAIGILMRRTAKTTYVVRIGSASGESDALSSVDRALIERIVGAMNQAIVLRG
jgi:hypothetical protein